MAFDPGWEQILGLLAAGLIAVLGAFVYLARPESWLHRAFLAFALADGGSTAALAIRNASDALYVRLYAMLAYMSLTIVLTALLAGFTVAFPRPLVSKRATRGALLAIGTVALAALVAHQADHSLFWSARYGARGALEFQYAPPGSLIVAAFVLSIGLAVLRVTYVLSRETSPSHREQAAFVLGGVVLGFAPYATVNVVRAFQRGGFFAPPWDFIVVRVSFGLVALALVATGGYLFSRTDRRARETRFVLACYSAVAAITILAAALASFADFLRLLALAAYPALVGYAIVRYHVLDIDPRLRRNTTFALAAAAVAAVFALAEQSIEVTLQGTLFGTTLMGSVMAGLTAVALAVPFVGLARRGIAKLAPGIPPNGIAERRLEIYLHALRGALEDGVIEAREVRMLTNLREALGISQAEHDELMRRELPRGAPA